MARRKQGLRGSPEEHKKAAKELREVVFAESKAAGEEIRRGKCGLATMHIVRAYMAAGAYRAHVRYEGGGPNVQSVADMALDQFESKCLPAEDRTPVHSDLYGLRGTRRSEGNRLIQLLQTVNPSDLNFAAGRYTSAERFRDAVVAAHANDTMGANSHIMEALEATHEDGGDYGTIPTISAGLQAVFDKATDLAV